MDIVRIFDTTLRDGEQAPGFSMNTAEKIRLARQIESLGADIIEAGFPIASKGDFEAVRAVGKEVRNSTVAALARARREDIEAALGALETAIKPRIHMFLATSDLHLKYKLRISRAEALDSIASMVAFAKSRCPDIEFSAEDSSRSDIEFLGQAFTIAADAGATTLNVPDTVGYTTPEEYASIFRTLRARLGERPGLVWSAHCHNDLGSGGGEFARGDPGWGAAGGVRHQRHWGARGQCGAGRDCRSAGGACGPVSSGHATKSKRTLCHESHAFRDHGRGSAAE